ASSERVSDQAPLQPQLYVEHQKSPRAGSVFRGIVITFPEPSRFHVLRLSCNASLGGNWIGHPPAGVVGGTRIRTHYHRYYTPRDASGHSYLRKVACQWWVPKSARGKLLSLGPD